MDMPDRPAQTSKPIHDLLARRWSPRAFDPNRPVTRDQLRTLLEAGRWAPSCNGDEPWRYLIWDKARDPQGWQEELADVLLYLMQLASLSGVSLEQAVLAKLDKNAGRTWEKPA